MPSKFEQRFERIAVPQLQREFGTLVCFCRGVYVSEPFTARRSDRVYAAMGAEYGISISVTMRDFILPVSALQIDGDEIKPRTADRIIEGDEVFEIQPPDDKTPSVELQAGQFEWLVHTKKVDDNEPT